MIISVRLKLTILLICILCFLVFIGGLFIYNNFSHAIYESDDIKKFDKALLKTINNVKRVIAKEPGFVSLIQTSDKKKFSSYIPDDLFLRKAFAQLRTIPQKPNKNSLIIIKNNALEDKTMPFKKKMHQSILKNEVSVETLKDIFPYNIRVATAMVKDINNNSYILQLAMSMRHIDTTLDKILYKFFMFEPFHLLVIFLLSYFFVKHSFSPVKRLVSLTKNISAENFSQRIENVYGNDEIGELTETLNDMIDRLENSFKQIKQFSDDVSHELRTPLTIIKGEIEVALKHERNNVEYIDILESLLEENGKLEKIIENLFLLSRMETKDNSFKFVETELDKIVLDAMEAVLLLAKTKKIEFRIRKIDAVAIFGNELLLKMLFINLFTNSIKYTNPGGTVSIELSRLIEKQMNTGRVLFKVSDTGIGIPEESQGKIFDRFYRVDESRSSRTGGSGLGLTIVKKILDLHKSTIKVRSKINQGTTFFIYFPNINKN